VIPMRKVHTVILTFCMVALALLAALAYIASRQPPTTPAVNITGVTGLTLYYGITCPHCKIVEEFLGQNDPENRLGVVQKEVYQNATNAQELTERAKGCGITSGIGVPFLVADGKCIIGDQPIIALLNATLIRMNAGGGQ
jgi:glutaredoxin